jgi:hypothetical protein
MVSVPEPTDDRYWAEQQRREEAAEKDADRVLQLERCIQQMVEYPEHMRIAGEGISDNAARSAFLKACTSADQTLRDIANMYDVAVQ